MGLFKDYVSQTRKPEGRLGEVMISGMNSGHAQMADWGMAHLKGVHAEKILEIGCGGGYIMISGAGKHPGLRSVLKMTNSIQRSLGGWKKMYDFFMAANGGDKTLEQKMKEAERPFVKVEMLLVTKDYQKQGYMRRLLEFAYKVAKENSCACILDTDARSKCDRYMHLGMELENTRQQAGFKIYDLIKE